METLAALITVLLFLIFCGSLIWLVYAAVKKKDQRRPAIIAGMSFVLMTIIAAIIPSSSTSKKHIQNNQEDKPDCSISEVKDALTLYYINTRIYPHFDCEAEKINDNWFIFCHPLMAKIGGLYLVKFDKNCNYTLYAVNGKAKQHAKRGLNAKDIYIPELKKLTGIDDISKILEEF